MKKIVYLNLLCVVIVSCQKQKHNYCQGSIDISDSAPKIETIILKNEVKLTFLNYWGYPSVTKEPYIELESSSLLVKDSSDLHKYEILFIKLNNNRPIEDYRNSLFATLQAEKAGIPKEHSITIKSINYEILTFETEHEFDVAAYGQVSDDFILYIYTTLSYPYPTRLEEIKNNKQRLIEEQTNRMYCILSTLEVEKIDPVYDVSNPKESQ
jgi:hypothetical protein